MTSPLEKGLDELLSHWCCPIQLCYFFITKLFEKSSTCLIDIYLKVCTLVKIGGCSLSGTY
jgi:hypothetical protein